MNSDSMPKELDVFISILGEIDMIKNQKNMSFRPTLLLEKARRAEASKKRGLAMNIFKLDYLP